MELKDFSTMKRGDMLVSCAKKKKKKKRKKLDKTFERMKKTELR